MPATIKGTIGFAGNPVYFVNSGDMRLIITGYAPTLGQQNPNPAKDTLSFGSDAPTLSFSAALPAKDALTISGLAPILNPVSPTITAGAPDSLAISETTATLVYKPTPAKDSVVIAGLTPARWTGLQFKTYAPTIGIDRVSLPTIDALVFSGEIPDAFTSGANVTRVPAKDTLALSGNTFAQSWQIDVPAGSVALSGIAPSAFDLVYPQLGTATLTGLQPTIEQAVGTNPPTVVIGAGFNEGTPIRNANAGPYWGNANTICDVTGIKCKPGELVEQWDGTMVHWEHYTPRNEQDFVRSVKNEKSRGATRPSDDGNETFIDPDNPVTADDL